MFVLFIFNICLYCLFLACVYTLLFCVLISLLLRPPLATQIQVRYSIHNFPVDAKSLSSSGLSPKEPPGYIEPRGHIEPTCFIEPTGYIVLLFHRCVGSFVDVLFFLNMVSKGIT